MAENGANDGNGKTLGELLADVRNQGKAIDALWLRDKERAEVIQEMRDEQIKMRTTLWIVGLLVSPVITALLVAVALAAAGMSR